MGFSSAQQKGIGLIEIMVSISIGIFILSGVIQLWATARNNASLNLNQANTQDNLRYIISQLEKDAAQVGVAGCFSQAFRQNDRYLGSILDASNVAPTALPRYDVNLFINGSENTGTLETDQVLFRSSPSTAAIPVKLHEPAGANSDQITLDLSTPYAQSLYAGIQQFDVLLAADCSGAVFFMVTNEPAADGVLQFAAGTIASSGINQGFANALPAGALKARLEDVGNLDNFEDNIIVNSWDENNSGALNSTRPYVYLTSASSTALYSIGDSQRATDLTASGEAASCSEDTPQFCALLRNGIEVAEGVLDFQIEYGWHIGGNEQGALRFGNAAQAAGNFNNVDRIRVTLQLNAVSSGNQMAELTRTYTRTIALRNQLGS